MSTVARVRTVLGGFTGGPGLMTQYFVAPTYDDSAAALMVDRVRDALVAGGALFPTTWTYAVNAEVDLLNAETGALTGAIFGTARSGTGLHSGSGYGPIASAVVVSWLTGDFVNGHRVRGRTFLSPVSGDRLDADGTPDAAGLTAANAFGSAMRNAGTTAVTLVVWHRPKGTSVGSPHTATGSTVRDRFGILRSRRD